jgi:hypothetical protein
MVPAFSILRPKHAQNFGWKGVQGENPDPVMYNKEKSKASNLPQ